MILHYPLIFPKSKDSLLSIHTMLIKLRKIILMCYLVCIFHSNYAIVLIVSLIAKPSKTVKSSLSYFFWFRISLSFSLEQSLSLCCVFYKSFILLNVSVWLRSQVLIRSAVGSNAEFSVHCVWWLTVLICPVTDEGNLFLS